MASSFLKGLVTDYGKLGYQLWHRPLKMASLVYEREIGVGAMSTLLSFMYSLLCSSSPITSPLSSHEFTFNPEIVMTFSSSSAV